MLLVPLWWPHLAQDQFQTPLGVWVAPEGGVVVIRNPVRLNSDFVKFRTSVVFELQRAGVVLGLNWP